MNHHIPPCYLCGEEIKDRVDIGGYIQFIDEIFPVCVKCDEED